MSCLDLTILMQTEIVAKKNTNLLIRGLRETQWTILPTRMGPRIDQ